MDTFSTLSFLLLIPLIPAFIIYRFLPSKTSVTGPFKGLSLNLTGAFGGYFLLVIISSGIIYSIRNNTINDELARTKNELLLEKQKFQQWEITGTIHCSEPEMTKIFVDGEYPKPGSTGKFDASLFILYDMNGKIHLPDAVCFYNKNEGYSIVDLTRNDFTDIDSSKKIIAIKDKIVFSKSTEAWSSVPQ